MVGLFSKKKSSCSICKKEVSHTHKPKGSWDVEGPLCANCYVDLMKENFEKRKEDKCALCGAEPGSFSLWRPNKEWGIAGWLCKPCFDMQEKKDNDVKNFCCLCGKKIGFLTYRPKKEWDMNGYMCKNCWNLKTRN